MESATKFISGHSDLMAGILAVKGERLKSSSVLYTSFSAFVFNFTSHPTGLLSFYVIAPY